MSTSYPQLRAENNGVERQELNMESKENVKGFGTLYTLTQIVGLLMIVASLLWILEFRGGFGWYVLEQRFYWHPFLMTVGFLYCTGNAILIYRGFRESNKRNLKFWHATLHVVTLVLVLLAAYCVLTEHLLAVPPIQNMYTLHSWMGAITVLLFLIQYLIAFYSFVSPGLSIPARSSLMSYHTFYGHLVFVMALATACVGLNERAASKGWTGEAAMAIIYGLLIVLFGIMVVFLSTRDQYKRHPRPEDGMLLHSS